MLFDHSKELEKIENSLFFPSFSFQQRTENVDWRRISCINLDKMISEQDFSVLQENLTFVAFCNMASVSNLDPLVLKIFQLAQYTIEYLLHSQEYLQGLIEDGKNEVESMYNKNSEHDKQITNLKNEINKLKHENKNRKQIIKQQQILIESGATSYFQCPHCSKAFANAAFLQSHISRRHPGNASYVGDAIVHAEMEHKRTKEEVMVLKNDLETEKDSFNQKIADLKREKLKWEDQIYCELDKWKNNETSKWQSMFECFKKKYNDELDIFKKRELCYEKQLQNLQKCFETSTTNLGELIDDCRDDKKSINDCKNKVDIIEKDNCDKKIEISSLSEDVNFIKNSKMHQLEMRQEEFLNRIESINKSFEKIFLYTDNIQKNNLSSKQGSVIELKKDTQNDIPRSKDEEGCENIFNKNLAKQNNLTNESSLSITDISSQKFHRPSYQFSKSKVKSGITSLLEEFVKNCSSDPFFIKEKKWLTLQPKLNNSVLTEEDFLHLKNKIILHVNDKACEKTIKNDLSCSFASCEKKVKKVAFHSSVKGCISSDSITNLKKEDKDKMYYFNSVCTSLGKTETQNIKSTRSAIKNELKNKLKSKLLKKTFNNNISFNNTSSLECTKNSLENGLQNNGKSKNQTPNDDKKLKCEDLTVSPSKGLTQVNWSCSESSAVLSENSPKNRVSINKTIHVTPNCDNWDQDSFSF